MTTLKDGRFLFIDAEGRLRVESEDRSNRFPLVYGGTVLAFALNAAQTVLALVNPSDVVTGLSPSESANPEQCCVRLFNFAGDTLGDLVAEQVVPLATLIVWVGERFLVTSFPGTLSTVMEVTKKSKLKIFVQDEGTFPISVGGLLGLTKSAIAQSTAEPASSSPVVSAARAKAPPVPSVDIWDLHKNRCLETVKLEKKGAAKGRRGRDTKDKVVITDSSSSGNFAVFTSTNGGFYALYGGGKSAVKLLTRVPATQQIQQQPPRKQRPKASEAVDSEQAVTSSAHRLAGPNSRVFCAALSPSHVVIGLTDAGEVGRYSYLKKDATLVEEGRCTLEPGDTLVAVGTTRYLVRKAEENGTLLPRRPVYMTYPIVIASPTATPASPSLSLPAARETAVAQGGIQAKENQGNAGEGETAAEKKKRKRNRKKKTTGVEQSDAPAASTSNAAPDKASGRGTLGVPVVAVAAGIAVAAVALTAMQLRRGRS